MSDDKRITAEEAQRQLDQARENAGVSSEPAPISELVTPDKVGRGRPPAFGEVVPVYRTRVPWEESEIKRAEQSGDGDKIRAAKLRTMIRAKGIPPRLARALVDGKNEHGEPLDKREQDKRVWAALKGGRSPIAL